MWEIEKIELEAVKKLDKIIIKLKNKFNLNSAEVNTIKESEIWCVYTKYYFEWYIGIQDINEKPVIDIMDNKVYNIHNLRILTESERYFRKYGFGDVIAVNYLLSLYSNIEHSVSVDSEPLPTLKEMLDYGLGKKFYNSYLSTNNINDISITILYRTQGWVLHNIFIGTLTEKYNYLRSRRSKFCTHCKTHLPKENFGINTNTYDGLSIHCNNCIIIKSRTKLGKIKSLYQKQRTSSRKRGHHLPNYNIEWFIKWCLNNNNFNRLYNAWVDSGYNTELAPSIDRLKNNISYTKDNIQCVTWKENYEKEYLNRNKPISITNTKYSGLVHYFENRTDASKFINISRTQFNRLIDNKVDEVNGYHIKNY